MVVSNPKLSTIVIRSNDPNTCYGFRCKLYPTKQSYKNNGVIVNNSGL